VIREMHAGVVNIYSDTIRHVRRNTFARAFAFLLRSFLTGIHSVDHLSMVSSFMHPYRSTRRGCLSRLRAITLKELENVPFFLTARLVKLSPEASIARHIARDRADTISPL